MRIYERVSRACREAYQNSRPPVDTQHHLVDRYRVFNEAFLYKTQQQLNNNNNREQTFLLHEHTIVLFCGSVQRLIQAVCIVVYMYCALCVNMQKIKKLNNISFYLCRTFHPEPYSEICLQLTIFVLGQQLIRKLNNKAVIIKFIIVLYVQDVSKATAFFLS